MFYFSNVLFLLALFVVLGYIAYYDKKVLGNTKKALPKAELRTLGIYSDETIQEMNEILLGWADLHDHPVRVKKNN